jgi:2-polyprenyl-6-methoxyphenol hydroxylase-like FAD-dependent oxidoreductase
MVGQRRALVIGGSMSGLFAAILLRQAGWRADIYERVDVGLIGRGAGIVTTRKCVRCCAPLAAIPAAILASTLAGAARSISPGA